MRRFLLWLVLGSLALRLALIGVGLLWYDELFTVAISRLPLLSMLQAIRGDVHPPLWYAMEWAWIHIAGTGPVALRLPSAIFGTAAVAELYQLVKRVGGETPARWAGILMAILPAHIYYSQEARMYSLLTLLVLLGARAIADRNWLRLGLVAPLILYTHNIGFVYVLTLSVWGLLAGRLAAFKKLALGAAFYLPWLVTAIHQATTLSRGFWLSFRPDVGALLYFIPFTTAFYRLPPELYMHATVLVFTLTGLGLFGLLGKFKKFAPVLALAFAPPAILYGVSFVWHPVLLDRSLLPSGAALLGIWGGGLSQFTGWGRKALAAVALPFAVIALITFYTDPLHQRSRTDPIKPMIMEQWQPGDALYFVTLDSWAVYNYYLPDRPQFILPEAGDLSQSLSEPTKDAMGISDRELSFSGLSSHGYKRAWLFIVVGPVTSDYEVAQIQQIRAGYPIIKEWDISRTDIKLIQLVLIGTEPGKGIAS
jgi:mannosyltransferase